MSSIFHRSLTKSYPKATNGDTIYLISADGKRVLDGSSGAAVSCLGHSNKEVIAAIVDQAQSLAFAHTSFFTNDVAEELASLLIEQSNFSFSKVMFLNSGSEAVESALKLARHYHVSNDDPGRVNIISRRYSYHGNTLGALAAGYNPPRRDTFLPLLSRAFHHVSPCFYSRDAQKGETVTRYVDRLMAEYEDMFQQLGPATVAAVIVEPVVGATLGSVPAAEGYLPRLRELCHKHGALIIFDEVMCGMGRVGTLHAWQSLGNCAPDLQTIGKGLAAGYQPLSAVMIGSKVHTKLKENSESRAFLSGHTYQGHAICCAAGLAAQKYLIKEKLLENVQSMGSTLVRLLKEKLPVGIVKDIRGLGLFQTLEFASTELAGGHIAKEVSLLSFEKGAAIYLCSPAVDGVLFAPPFIINEEQIQELVDIVASAVVEVLEKRLATKS